MHTSLECSLTGEIHDHLKLQGLSRAGKPLLARYDLGHLKGRLTPAVIRARSERSLWRFFDVLPVDSPDQAISLEKA